MAARLRVIRLLVVAGSFATLLALVAGYTRHELLDGERFAGRAAAAARAPAVREDLGEQLADALIARQPRLISARPAIVDATGRALASEVGQALAQRVALDLHRTIFQSEGRSVLLNLIDLRTLVEELLRTSDPQLAARLARRPIPASTAIADGTAVAPVLHRARKVSVLAIVAPVLALACFGGALTLAPRRRSTVLETGIALLAAAALGVTVLTIVRATALASASPADAALTSAVLGAFLDDFWWWAGSVALAGALLVTSAAALLSPGDPSAIPRGLWHRLSRTPRARGWQAVRGAGLVVTGVLILLQPGEAMRLAAAAFGAFTVLAGLIALMQLLGARAPVPGRVRAARRRRAALITASAAALLALPTAAEVLAAGSHEAVGVLRAGPGCYGSTALCDRRLDEVVFPASHNANATAADGYLNANHAISMVDQLDLGIRALLIDTVEGQRNARGVVRTDLAGETRATIVAKVGERGLASAQRIAGSVVFGPLQGDTESFLCHVMCEVGATPIVDGLRQIDDWLARNPREVLVLFVQDDSPAEQVRDAFAESGLRDRAFTLRAGAPLPTLREMLRARRPLLVLAENQGKAGDWFHDGFTVAQDTRYDFTRVAELAEPAACTRNRGAADAPLLLVNHWVEDYPPNPVDADALNTRQALVERARRCGRARGLVPNLLAVDFVERGDVVGAAAELNAAG